jgi:hypothetical protein
VNRPRPPRRTLRRQARTLPAHLEVRRLQLQLEAAARPATVAGADLERLFGAVWQRGTDAVWSVRELKQLGLVEPSRTRSTGRALADLVAAGGVLGRWVVHRVDCGGKKQREGRLWRLSRRW